MRKGRCRQKYRVLCADYIYTFILQHFAGSMPLRAAKLQAKRMQRQAARAQATATEEVTRQKVLRQCRIVHPVGSRDT
jgi:hypothetical protein